MTGIFFKFTEVLPSGQDEVRREEVNEEEEGGIEYWSEEEWGEEWEQWEFVTEDDEEDQEYEGDEEDDDDEEEEEEEVPVLLRICAWSALPDHAMQALFMVTQDIKFVALNVLQG